MSSKEFFAPLPVEDTGSEHDPQTVLNAVSAEWADGRTPRMGPLSLSRRVKLGSLVFASLVGCAALTNVVVNAAGPNRHLHGHKSVMGLNSAASSSAAALDCSGEEKTRVLTDGSDDASDPCKALRASQEMKENAGKLKEQQEKLEKAAYAAHFQARIEQGKCSAGLANCNETKCCNAPGAQCYTQNEGFAQCRQSCTPGGPDPTHWDPNPWDCQPLGERTPGENVCVDMGENCIKSQCCNGVGLQCYEKNSTFASCKVDCVGGSPDMSDPDPQKWTCKELGPRSLSTAGWVWGSCAKTGENCGGKKCCSEAGMQCYAQQDEGSEVFWGLCKEECNAGVDPRKPWEKAWSCHEVGARTPTAPVKGSKVEKWALEPGACSSETENCKDTRCCLGVDVQCYEKDDKFAQCKRWCEPGKPDANNETWSCKPLSTRSWGLATKGWPSLFCFSLARTTGYEVDILKAQYKNQIGIFACDDAAVLAADGVLKLAEGVVSLKVEMAEITTSQDGTAGNAKLFVNVWKAIIADGRFWNYAWTIKVDPDAVLMPERMRHHMATYTGENVFVVNCNKFTNSPNFPMMYGAVEVYSNKAMATYAAKYPTCLTDMGMMLPKWGEDFYMTRCMDHIGVGRVGDWFSLGDERCLGANCKDPRSASYHAFKDLGSWMQCHSDAVASER